MTHHLVDEVSPLSRNGGWVVTECLSPDFLPYLVRESCRASLQFAEDRALTSGDERGNPDRWLLRAAGGEALDVLYQSPGLIEVLATLTGTGWVRSGDHASYAYYCRPGHYLGRHFDADDCELAVITCLRDERPSGTTGSGLLRLHCKPSVDLRLEPGQSLVLLGGAIEHEVLPLGPDHVRVITALCFVPA